MTILIGGKNLKYEIIEIYKGEERVVDKVTSLEIAESRKKTFTIKYADCNTSYEIREIE